MLKWHFKKLSCESIGRRWVHAFTVYNMTSKLDMMLFILYNISINPGRDINE